MEAEAGHLRCGHVVADLTGCCRLGHQLGDELAELVLGSDNLVGAVRPRWVTAFIVIGAVFVRAVVILALAGGHSPGRHGG